MTPTWRVPSDLQRTRISEKQHDLLLTFKQVEWQTLRVEADCMVGDKNVPTTPLRLITNQSKLRVAVKKRYSGTVVSISYVSNIVLLINIFDLVFKHFTRIIFSLLSRYDLKMYIACK